MPNHTQSSPLKIIFAGTPHFAAYHLQALIDSEHDIVAVYTQPDRPSGRGKKLTPSPVKSLALQHQLPVEQPLSLKHTEAQKILADYQADVMVVVAYGLLLPQAVLDLPQYGCLNVHGSLLPRWRGAAPIQRAIEKGDSKSGVTIMQMDKGLDTGDMLLKSECVIEATDTSSILHDKLMALGAPALLEVLGQVQNQSLTPEKQDDELACYAEKITKQEAEINWQEPAATIAKKIQAFNPFPIAYSFLNQERIKVHAASAVELSIKNTSKFTCGEIISADDEGVVISCGKGELLIKTLQIPNKKAMSAAELINGYKDKFMAGECFSSKSND